MVCRGRVRANVFRSFTEEHTFEHLLDDRRRRPQRAMRFTSVARLLDHCADCVHHASLRRVQLAHGDGTFRTTLPRLFGDVLGDRPVE